MSCLFLLNNLKVGGSEKKTVRIANALKKRGHDVHLAFLNGPDTLLGEVTGQIPVVSLGRQGKFDQAVVGRLGSYLQESGIDKIFCINLYPAIYGIGSGFSETGKRVENYVFVNTSDFLALKEKAQMLVYAPLLRFSNGVVFGCHSQRRQWISRYRLPPDKTSVLYNGVDCAHFSPDRTGSGGEDLRKDLGIPERDVVIVNVAAFRPEKKQEDLVRAVGYLRRRGHPVHLVLVGDGPEKERTVRKVEELGLAGAVHFPGSVEDVRPFLAMADAFVLTSVAVETFSNAALEAMAMGRPVVLSDVGGAAEMLNGENGLLYRAGDVRELTEKLQLVLENPELRKAMGGRARELVEKRFTFEGMIDQYELLLRGETKEPLPLGGSSRESTWEQRETR